MSTLYEATARSRLTLAIFRRNVVTLRTKLGFTKSYMARKCDMTFKSYGDFEKGTTFPKGEKLISIAYALGCCYEQLTKEII